MRHKHLGCVGILILYMFIISSPTSVHAAGEVIILDNHSVYIAPTPDSPGGDTVHVVGEVQNVGDTTVKLVRIVASLFDSINRSAGNPSGYAYLTEIPPGMKSPFDISEPFNKVEYKNVSRYTLSIQDFGESPGEIPRTLWIVDHVDYSSSSPTTFHINGKIQNNGTEQSTQTEVFLTCYDSDSNVIYVAKTVVNPHVLDPDQSGFFDFQILEPQVSLLDRYELTTASQEAIIIPEFPYLTITIFIAILATMIILQRQTTRPKIL